MIHRRLFDDPVGHAAGWNPNGIEGNFFIQDRAFDYTQSTVVVNIGSIGNQPLCDFDFRYQPSPHLFGIHCVLDYSDSHTGTGAPVDYTILDYLIINLPPSGPSP